MIVGDEGLRGTPAPSLIAGSRAWRDADLDNVGLPLDEGPAGRTRQEIGHLFKSLIRVAQRE